MKKYWIWLLLLGFCLNGCGKDMPGTEQIMPLPAEDNLPDLETVSEETIPPETVQETETAAELPDMPEEELSAPLSEPYIRMLSGEEHFSCTMLTLLGDYPDLTILCGTNAGLALCLALAEGPISEAELEDIIRQSREQIINCTRLMKDTPEYEEEDL